PRAWQFASVGLALLAALLAAIVVLGEGGLAVAAWFWAGDRQAMQLLGLSAALLPYLLLVCLAAQLSATLQALGRFGLPAFAPALLNAIWLIGVWLAASAFDLGHQQRAYVVAVSILVAGCVQVAVQARALGRLGFRWHYNWQASRAAVIKVVAATGPMVLGLAVTQINTLCDSLMAWGLTAPAPGRAIGWLGGVVDYPFRPGAAAAIYFAERLYQFPLGILGVAVATVIFPSLSRHAARGATRELGAELSVGLRLVLLLGLPASAGLVLLCEPLATLFFRHGEVTAADAARLSRMIACYGLGVWAFCASLVLVRGYYARGDQRTPLRMAWLAMGVNVLLNLLLVWPLGECGLALSTSLAGVVQLAGLAWAFDKHQRTLAWPALRRSAWQAATTTAGMAACSSLALMALPVGGHWALWRVAGPVAAGMIAVFVIARLLGMDELALLWPQRRRNHPAQPAETRVLAPGSRPVSHAAAIR
ncbi:MAG TPA: lipid II flippase MurJ, partial [Pirellulales bacterium]